MQEQDQTRKRGLEMMLQSQQEAVIAAATAGKELLYDIPALPLAMTLYMYVLPCKLRCRHQPFCAVLSDGANACVCS